MREGDIFEIGAVRPRNQLVLKEEAAPTAWWLPEGDGASPGFLMHGSERAAQPSSNLFCF
jgi:hypothetical protein